MDKIQTPEEFAKEKYFSACSFGGNVHVSFYNNLIRDLKNRDAAVRAALVKAGVALVKEWDILPAEMPLRIEDITEWLHRYLGPQVEALRAALEAAKGE